MLKNLLGREGIHVYATRRSHGLGEREGGSCPLWITGTAAVSWSGRDVIVSATESPHYTLTAGETKNI